MHFQTPDGAVDCRIDTLIVAGWTGRDAAAVQHHIEELALLGVPTPSTTPLFYRVGANLLCQTPAIEVLGAETSGEAEPVLVKSGGRLWLGLGSDHTDRALEAVSVAASKQVCPKPLAGDLWAWDDVADRLDALKITSEIHEGGTWVRYQSGTLAAIRPLADLMAAADLPDEAAMMCGTLPAIGGVRAAERFRARLEDPGTGRSIEMDYSATALPVIA